ncbi:hypothetical protein D3C85_1473330 [compost metagenome]
MPKADLMVAVGLGDGPLPAVVTAMFQRAPVGVCVRTAAPRFTVPVVVVAVAVMVLPVPREVVPDRTQYQRLLLRAVTVALVTIRFSLIAAETATDTVAGADSAFLASLAL